jgi:Flp pilus assembly protein TadD
MLPVVLLGLELLRPQPGRRRRLLALIPFFALALLLGSVTLWFQWTRALASTGDARSMAERLLWPGWTVATYLRHALLPVDLALLYPPWPVSPGSWWFAAPTVLMATLLAAAWRWGRGPGRGLFEALAYHAIMVLPVAGIVHIAFFLWSPVANHLQYLALPGPLASAASLLAGLRPGRWRRAGVVALVAALAAMGLSTHLRARAFTDDSTLWEAAARQAPDSLHASWMHAVALRKSGQPSRALGVLAALAEGAGDEGTRHAGRCLWLLEVRRHREALEQALAFDRLRHDHIFQLDVSIKLLSQGAAVEALALLAPLARRNPGSWEVRTWQRQALDSLRRGEAARGALRAGCRGSPGDGWSCRTLALLAVDGGDPQEARSSLARALQRSEADPEVERELAAVAGGL